MPGESWFDEPELRDVFVLKGKTYDLPRAFMKPEAQSYYRELRVARGLSHDKAEDEVRRVFFPASAGGARMVGSNDQLIAGVKTDFAQFPDKEVRDFHIAAAKRNGVDTAGAFYHPSLARYIGDPDAWCKSGDDVIARAKARGWEAKRKGAEIEMTVTPESVAEALIPKPEPAPKPPRKRKKGRK